MTDSEQSARTESGDEILEELFAVILDRKDRMPANSYTATLLEAGEDEILEKIGEEATEVLLAAKADEEAEIAHESADLVYHLLVLLAAKDMGLDALVAELRDRR